MNLDLVLPWVQQKLLRGDIMRRDLIVISAIFLFSICLGLTGCSMSVKDAKSTDENEFERFDTPYTRCEANDDGTYSMYIYAAPVQFKKDNQYYKKDNSIVESPDSKSTYENKENDIKTIISKVMNIRIERKVASLTDYYSWRNNQLIWQL